MFKRPREQPKPCRRPSGRLEGKPGRAEGPLYVWESRPDCAEGTLYVQGRPDRAEGPLHVQAEGLTVQRALCTSRRARLKIFISDPFY